MANGGRRYGYFVETHDDSNIAIGPFGSWSVEEGYNAMMHRIVHHFVTGAVTVSRSSVLAWRATYETRDP